MREIKFYFGISLLAIILIYGAKHTYKNITPSIKLGYYFAVPLFYKIKSGDLIIFCLHKKLYIDNLKELKLVMNNQCDNKMPYFIKKVIALRSDKITINESGIYLNDKLVKGTKPLKEIYSKQLIHSNIVDYKLQDDEFIVIGDNYSSYDSRYFGVIRRKDINKVAFRMFGY